MQEFSRYKKLLIIAAVCAVLALGAYGGLWYWSIAMQSDVDSLQITLDVEARKEKRHRLLREAVRNTEDARAELGAYIVSRNEIVDVIERIEFLGSQVGAPVTFQTVNTRDEVLVLDFSAAGTFQANYRLLSLLETLPFQYSINRFWLEQPAEQSETEEPWKSSVQITIRGFM